MTDPAPPPLEPGTELVVARRARLLRGLGWPLVVMALGIALLAAMLVLTLLRGSGRDDLIGELACQVQQLGGKPVGDVDCPPAKAPKPTVRPSPAARVSTGPTTARSPAVIVVPGPRGPAGSPAARPPAPASSPRASAQPRPTSTARATPSPSPIVQICPPRLPCLPPHRSPRPRSR